MRAWPRVLALVVQPGVEFDHHKVIDYRPDEARGLSAFIDAQPQFVFEAHSTDYQRAEALGSLVRDHFAILKVGPGATFALRETLWGLAAIEQELLRKEPQPDLRKVVVGVMRADPVYWRGHYAAESENLELDLQFSLSDRIRYYWPHPEVQRAVEAMFGKARPHADSADAPQPVPAARARCRASGTHPRYAGRDPAGRRRARRCGPTCCLRPPGRSGTRMSAFPGLVAAELESRGARWTAEEIAQQPAVWCAVGELVVRERGRLDAFLQPLLANPRLRVVLTGAGTSAFIGDCLAPALSARLDRRVEAIATTDLLSGPHLRLPSDGPTLLVSFARSGNSPESVAAVELAEQFLPGRVSHLVITCNADGALAARARGLANACGILMPEAAHDRGFAMTSSFSAMLLAGAMAFRLVDRACGRPPRPRGRGPAAPRCRARAAPRGRGFERVVYLGSNELRGLAAEAALKLLELTDGRVVAVSESTLAFRHGPKTIINERTLVVVLLSNDAYARAYDRDLLRELRRDGRAGGLLALGARPDGIGDVESLIIPGMSDASDLELVPLLVLVAQSFALIQSLALGLTPDSRTRPAP